MYVYTIYPSGTVSLNIDCMCCA